MINNRKKIFAISGSTRKNSSNEKILQAAARLYKDELEVEIYTGIDELPHFSPDIKDEDVVPVVNHFRQKIEKADGVIICSPEYVFSLPGTLKNALEWTVSTTVFSYKPVAFIIASASGEKAFEALDLIMKTLVQTEIPDNLKLLIKGGQSKINEAGDFVDEEVKEKVVSVVIYLMKVIDELTAGV